MSQNRPKIVKKRVLGFPKTFGPRFVPDQKRPKNVRGHVWWRFRPRLGRMGACDHSTREACNQSFLRAEAYPKYAV